jgi:predicted esterase
MSAACPLLHLRRDGPQGESSRWVWREAICPPSTRILTSCGFAQSEWAEGIPRNARNLLLLLHGLGDTPSNFARFASRLELPQTSALAIAAPIPLPCGLPGTSWLESFEETGELIDGTRPGDRRRADSLRTVTRPRLQSLLHTLELHCGWPRERIFLFGYAQGGVAALDTLAHLEGGRLGGVVSWCGLPLPEAQALAPSRQPASKAASRNTPLLVVVGEEGGEITSTAARRLFEHMRAAWSQPPGGVESGDVAESAEQALHVLRGRSQSMVCSATEATLLMSFWARHLSLNSALEDDPSIIRVG